MKLYLLAAAIVLLTGCGDRIEHFVMPDQVTDFTALFKNNCVGCHGAEGRLGPARPLNDPLFLAVIGKDTLKGVLVNGRPNTAMPAFAQSAGGSLTDAQLSILADQMVARWSRPQNFAGVTLPPYGADLGDANAGEITFRARCAACHGKDGASETRSIVDPFFLALVSDQSLRTTIIAGRTDRGMPAFRALPSADISNLVAWIAGHRQVPITLTQRGQLP